MEKESTLQSIALVLEAGQEIALGEHIIGIDHGGQINVIACSSVYVIVELDRRILFVGDIELLIIVDVCILILNVNRDLLSSGIKTVYLGRFYKIGDVFVIVACMMVMM